MKLRYPDHIRIYTDSMKLDYREVSEVNYSDIALKLDMSKDVLTAEMSAVDTPIRYVRLRWTFTDNEKRHEPVKICGDEWERAYGQMEWRGISAKRCMPWVCLVSNGSDSILDYSERHTECFGVKVRPDAMCFWQYDGAGVTLWLDTRSGGLGVVLKGSKIKLCEVIFGDYTGVSAFVAAKEYYRGLCDDKLSVGHKVYGNNNWYYAYGNSSDNKILEDTKLLTQCCHGLTNRPYMVIDSCWEQNPCDGPWDVLRSTFGNMKKLADDIKEMGAHPGIWFRPLSDMTHSLKLADECRVSWANGFLDPSHPDVLKYVADTVRMISHDWGYKLIKHDFSTSDIFGVWGFERQEALARDGWHFYDRSKTSAQVVTGFYRKILEAADKDTLILGCNVIGHLAAGLVHLNRVGDDTSGEEWERTRNYGVNALAFRLVHHGAFYESDADCIGITEKIDWKLNSEWLRLLSISGTPLFVSPKPEAMTDTIISELKNAYERNSVQADELVPLDWMENVCPERWRVNGEETCFHWYPDDGVHSFEP